MNKEQYCVTRRLLRDNGNYALRWMTSEEQEVWEQLISIKNQRDPLAVRAAIIRYCYLSKITCNVRQTRID